MADIVMGAVNSLVAKLGELLKEEYNLQTDVKERIRRLTMELEGAKGALHMVAEVPRDQLDCQVKLWAREVRESSYDMEDVLDTYLVHVQSHDSAIQKSWLEHLGETIGNLFKKSKARHEISVGVKDIITHLDEVMERCRRYKVDIVARPATTSTIDPRLPAMYNKLEHLVGIDKSSSELISMLHPLQHGSVLNANTKMKIVSVVGVGGLGKTALAKAIYDKHKGDFDRGAFVPVGRNPDLKKVIQRILITLDNKRYMEFKFGQFSEIYQFINELKDFLLQNKRYFIVIDDVWEIPSWDTIKLAIDDENNCGGRIIVTTRKMEVATKAGEVYKLQPLPNYSSRELFYKRMYGDEGSHVDNEPDEISDKILKKCGGIPLAIITMASLLADKPRDKWYEIYETIGFGRKDSNDAENTMTRILSFSYYDLPLHLRTCLLYLGTFPEDSIIYKGPLIWRWVAEGFIHEEQGTLLFETGEGYFNDLINRSLIQGVETECVITGCRVHDIVLDFIRSMSHEENFFTILDNSGQDTPSKSPIRRLAHHNMTIRWHTIHETVRSFSVQGCVIESWVPLFSFTFLRVLAIEDCHPIDGCCLRVEHVGKLLHLRYLRLSRTPIHRVPEEIGALRLLQTLDLLGSEINETPSSSSLPIQLVCLRISLYYVRDYGERGWVERLTSLEELFIDDRCFQWKELRSLRELRVLNAYISVCNSESMGYLSHLDKLQHLSISSGNQRFLEAASFVLPHQLRYFSVPSVEFPKLPPCINPSGLPHLSHLYLQLVDMDEQDLKNLGGLPELLFLGLVLYNSAAMISNINDSNVGYFPKLRCLNLCWAMVLFVASKVDKNVVSFHLWDGDSQIAVPFDSEGDELQRSLPAAAASDHENKEGGSIFIGEGIAAAPHHRFMPSLQVLQIRVPAAALDHPYCMCDNLIGWEYLSSLREISVDLSFYIDDASDAAKLEKVKEALRRAAEKHPNHPTLLFMEEEEEDGGDDNDDSSDDGGGNGDGDAASDDGDDGDGDDDGGNGDDGDDGATTTTTAQAARNSRRRDL
ncbi:hypothetical protein BS78_K251200 [Paspalum vaginatum]|uniref:AAA+ ATPase domain-containing protein n=1 Tax=Paspalum vaginatum TaxID=158149 RepID=A0A9W7X8N9_9POAL|nr:hypothetical protein BS78_K251200 [Paspalum vaginatum]